MSDPAPAVAPDLETLYDLETAYETASKARLAQLGLDRVQLPQGKGDQHSGRVDAWLILGTARANSAFLPANLDEDLDSRASFENAWNATLCFNVVTNRTKALPGLHRKYVAKVRVLMAQFFDDPLQDLLPFHELVDVHSAGTTPGLETDKEEDVTQLRFAAVLGILDTAWPAPYGRTPDEEEGDGD